MDTRLSDFLLRFAAGTLAALGVVVLLVGYLGVRNESDTALQMPYVVSGGLGGLGLMALGALALLHHHLRIQARRYAEITGSLEDWKDQALAEVRHFLETAVIDVEVNTPSPPVSVTRRTQPANGAAERRSG